MSHYYKPTIIIVFFLLIAANIFVFISGVSLSDEINRYDREMHRLQQENLELEKKLYGLESLNYAASLAAELNYTKKAPVYIENIKVALR